MQQKWIYTRYKPRCLNSSKEIRGKSIVDSGPKPYSEYRVGIKSEQDPAKRAILTRCFRSGKAGESKKIKSWNRRYEEEYNYRTKNRIFLRR